MKKILLAILAVAAVAAIGLSFHAAKRKERIFTAAGNGGTDSEI